VGQLFLKTSHCLQKSDILFQTFPLGVDHLYASGDTHTDKTYTGQRSYASDFGLQYYNARWYDI
jgi:hypothetical protein